MTTGPKILQFPSKIRVCTLCDYFDQEMEHSGLNPKYRYICKHPKWDRGPKWFSSTYRVIGDNYTHMYAETPMWCPVLFEKRKGS